MEMCGEQSRALGQEAERWRVAWWNNEQHLSPINSLYLPPSLCGGHSRSPVRHHMVAPSLAVWASFYENHPLMPSSPLHFRSRTGDSWQQPPFWTSFHADSTRHRLRDEQKTHCFQFYCSDLVSELLHCPFPSVKWTYSGTVLWFWETKWKRSAELNHRKRKHVAWGIIF